MRKMCIRDSLYSVGAGLCLFKTAGCVIKCAADMEKRLSFAKSDRLGYLTACPTNTGTGMRASAMLHVPGLIRAGVIKRLADRLTKAGYALRGEMCIRDSPALAVI